MKSKVNIEKLTEERKLRDFKRVNKIAECKNELIAEALTTLISRGLSLDADFTNEEKDLIKEFALNYVEVTGANTILRNLDTKTYLLSETSRVINKYFDAILEDVSNIADPSVYKLDVKIMDSFYKELEGLDMEKADEVIAKRVRNNTYDYIKTNLACKDAIEVLITDVAEKMDELKKSRAGKDAKSRLLGENAKSIQRIREMSGIDKNPYGKIMKNIATRAYNSERSELKDADNNINYQAVEKYTNAAYGFLEGLNTLKVTTINIDKELDKYITV